MTSWLWSYVKKYRFRIVAGLLLVIVVTAMNMVNPFLSGTIVDSVILGGKTSLLWKILVAMLATVVCKTMIRYGYQMIFENVSQSVIKAIRKDLFALMQRLDFGYYDRTKTGDLMALMTGDIDAVRHFHAWVIYQVAENGLLFIVSVVVLFFINWQFALCLTALTPFIGFAAFKLARKVLPAFRAVRDQFSRLNSVAQENIGGTRVVRAFVREEFEMKKLETESLAFRQRNLENAAIWARYIPIIEFFSGLFPVLLVVVGGAFIIWGKLTMGQFVIFNSLIWALAFPLRMSGWLVNDIQRFVASSRRLHELSQNVPAIQGPAISVTGVRDAPTEIRGSIRFEGVSFAYGGADRPRVLTGIDFSAEPGQTIGIVGPTGSGKSTIGRLLTRFYDPTEGRILLDGRDLRDYPLETVRRNVGVAMQDVFLYSDTIEGNISFGKPDLPMEEVLAASRMACADGFVRDLPAGYDTVVGERGVGLSGGQKQRVALARLIAMDPPVMILDDTMSAVDVETEEELQESIRALRGSRTLFIIAHRISSVKHADQILVVRDGRIAERGRHSELLAADGLYAEVCRHQAGMEN